MTQAKDTIATTPRNFFIGQIFDVVGPFLIFVVLKKFGVPDFWTLICSGVIAVAGTAINTWRQRHLDRIGILVLIEVALSIVLLFVSGDSRIMLAKPSLYTGIAGIYLLANSFYGKPPNYETIRAIAAKGGATRASAFDRAWEVSEQFRFFIRLSSIGWGVACLADAVLRVAIVYTESFDKAVWLANVPHVTALVLLIGFSAYIGKNLERLVDQQLAV